MKQKITRTQALDIICAITDTIKRRHPDLPIFFREENDPIHGSAYVHDIWAESRHIIIDKRMIRNSELVDTIDCMNVSIAMFHEEGHVKEFEKIFKENTKGSRQMALCALMGRYMPEYRYAIYTYDPVEAYAEKNGIAMTKIIFANAFKQTSLDKDEPSIDDLLVECLKKYSPILHKYNFDSTNEAITILNGIIMKDPRYIEPDRKALANKLYDPYRPSIPSWLAQFVDTAIGNETKLQFR